MIEAVWERIERWLGTHAPAVLAGLNPPADLTRVAAAEQHLGVTFPDDFRATYLRHDGQWGEGAGYTLFDGWEWLSLDGIVQQWGAWKDLLDRGAFGESRSESDGRVVTDWWHPRLVPFTDAGSGDHHSLDLNPGPAGTVGQVIMMWHDDAARPVEAESSHAWLTKFADAFEAGAYVLSEEYGGLIRREDV